VLLGHMSRVVVESRMFEVWVVSSRGGKGLCVLLEP